jgi:zinc/manganese transport system ATP-binding protein
MKNTKTEKQVHNFEGKSIMIEVSVKNATISCDRHPIIHHISCVFKRGSLTAITGPNGAGKSSFLKAIAGVTKIDEGKILISTKNISFLSQFCETKKDFPISVADILLMGFWRRLKAFKKITIDMKNEALSALEVVGLAGCENMAISSLSSGQFQRVLFARMMLQNADLILLDEPFSTIDDDTAKKLIEIILKWRNEGKTIICVLHNIDFIKKYFPLTLLLAREFIAFGDSKKVLTEKNLIKTNLAWASHFQIKNSLSICEMTKK